jgi:hypothetical protein
MLPADRLFVFPNRFWPVCELLDIPYCENIFVAGTFPKKFVGGFGFEF